MFAKLHVYVARKYLHVMNNVIRRNVNKGAIFREIRSRNRGLKIIHIKAYNAGIVEACYRWVPMCPRENDLRHVER